jgi:hypothetical protein
VPLVIFKSDAKAREKPCLRCGYSLRKIESTHCPECGLSVWLSLNSNNDLGWSNPPWLRRMALGLLVMSLAMLPGLVTFGIGAKHRVDRVIWEQELQAFYEQLGPGTPPAPGSFPRPPVPSRAKAQTELLTGAAILGLYHVGLVVLTTHERRYPDRLKGWRIASWVSAGAAALTAALLLAGTLSPAVRSGGPTLIMLVGLLSAVVTWGYLRQLARRLPSSALARTCAWLMLVPFLSFLKVFPFIGAWLAFRFAWVLEFLMVVYVPVAVALFVVFAIRFRRESVAADNAWTAETAKPGEAQVHHAPQQWHD